ncbi:NAD(P)H-dependent oxidoreductase [Pseudoneobacillus sp. C159]
MNVLIVFAHPSADSYNAALKMAVIEALTERGASIKISDLYEMNFNPVASMNDVVIPTNLEDVPMDLRLEREKVAWADFIIFQFPMWWTSVPAILKGWFDRVFAAGFAYGPGIYNHGNFKGKKAMLSFTVGGKNLNSYGPRAIKGDMNERLFGLHHEILYFSGMDVIMPFIVPAHAGVEERKEYIELLKAKMANLETEPTIQFHPIEDYEGGRLKDYLVKTEVLVG